MDLVVTSPPFWALRNYGIPPTIWGGDPRCVHEWVEVKDGAEGYTSKTRWQHGKNGRGEEAVIRRDSPEYWGTNIREYSWCQKCGAWMGTLGLEPHPQLYVDHMVEVCQGIRRVLKPTGSLWLNLGDSYASMKGKGHKVGGDKKSLPGVYRGLTPNANPNRMLQNDGGWLQPKQLLGIPWRVATALQDEGWILRNCIVWHKPNHMPESIIDRFTKSYEFMFFFAKQAHYYFNLDEVREPYSEASIARIMQPSLFDQTGGEKQLNPQGAYQGEGNANRPARIMKGIRTKIDQIQGPNMGEFNKDPYKLNNPHDARVLKGLDDARHKLGKNPGDMWSIPTHPFTGAHFAVFPEALVEPIIKAASPPQGIVLDPFAGSGTTLRVARRLGRQWVGVELNPEYAEMCMARVKADDYAKTPDDVMPLIHFTNEPKDDG